MKTLLETVATAQLPTVQTPELSPLTDALKAIHGQSIAAILLYGSCKKSMAPSEGLIDLCVLLKNYNALPGFVGPVLNRALPPNVYFLRSGNLQSKYAVISLDQFEKRVASKFDHYFWARFSQPFTVLHTDSAEVAERIQKAQIQALATFYSELRQKGVMTDDPLAFWSQGLRLTYACDLRPEPPDHANRLVTQHSTFWVNATEALDAQFPEKGLYSLACRLRWQLRPVYGKLLNLLRLLKAAGTFSNGMDYIAWKIGRHSGVHFEPSPWMNRFPRIAGLTMAWRLWRQGGFR